MKCSEIEDLLYMLADDELSIQDKEKILTHIKGCKECYKEYSSILNMKKLISSNIQAEYLDCMDIKIVENRNKNRSKIFMRKKVIVTVAASILLISTIVPVNGQTLLNNFKEWVRSINFINNHTNYNIETNLEMAEHQQNTQKYHKTKIYDSIKEIEASKNFEYKVELPKYIPDGYRFSNVVTDTFDNGITNILSLKYKKTGINNDNPSLYIDYEYIKKDIQNREIRFIHGTQIKQVEVKDYTAYLHYIPRIDDEKYISVGLDTAVDLNDFKMLRIGMFINSDELENGVPLYIEEQLIKIAESIMK